MKGLRHKASKLLSQKVEYRKSESTAIIYSKLFDRLLIYAKESRPMRIRQDMIYQWLYSIPGYQQRNQAINAVQFYFREVEYKKVNLKIKRPKKPKRIPRDIPFSRIEDGFERMENKKHRAIVILMFACGLRVGEVINFRMEWIIREDMKIKVTGKGNKQRLVPYDDQTARVLNDYAKSYDIDEFLFSGQGCSKYSYSSILNICRDHFDCSPHQLRHTYAVRLLEKGFSINVISELLGHEDIRTTMTYLRVTDEIMKKVSVF